MPRLAGLSSSYLVKQLVDYDGPWRHEKVMSPIAARLSDADRLAVSRYYEGVDIVRAPAAGSPDGAALYASGDPERGVRPCADCHGEYAEGIGLASPRLAGQTQTYLRKQLIAWKESTRRNDPRDQMGAIARRLTEIDIDALARYLAGLQ